VAPCDHILQLFDDPDSLADCLAGFVEQGIVLDETILVVSGAAQWSLAAQRVAVDPRRLSDALASGQLVTIDSATTLERFRRGGSLSRALFEEEVGALVRQLRARGRPVRVYGEMVDLLAVEGDFEGARRLEKLWNDLAMEVPFTLLCGYSAVLFGDPASADALTRICRSHSHVRVSRRDLLATFLLEAANPDLVA
jgi:hypothetical protein